MRYCWWLEFFWFWFWFWSLGYMLILFLKALGPAPEAARDDTEARSRTQKTCTGYFLGFFASRSGSSSSSALRFKFGNSGIVINSIKMAAARCNASFGTSPNSFNKK